MDYSKIEEGMTYTNSTSFRLLHELDHVKSLSQVGVRSMRDQKSDVNDALNNGSRIIKMSEIREKGAENIWNHMPSGEDCYVTVDIDAYDMSLVPGCVSAEPNGFYFDELKKALKSLNDKMNIVGFDFVEVNPKLDVGTNVTSYLGALTVAIFLGFIETFLPSFIVKSKICESILIVFFPKGPSIFIIFPAKATLTFSGIDMFILPILDIKIPYKLFRHRLFVSLHLYQSLLLLELI